MKEIEQQITRGQARREAIGYEFTASEELSASIQPKIPKNVDRQPNAFLPGNKQIFASMMYADKLPPVILPRCDWCDPLRISRSLIAAADADEEVEEILAEEQGKYLLSALPQDILDTALTPDTLKGFTLIDIDEEDSTDLLLREDPYTRDVIKDDYSEDSRP